MDDARALRLIRRDRIRTAFTRAHARNEAVADLTAEEAVILAQAGMVEITDTDTRLTDAGHILAEAVRAEYRAWQNVAEEQFATT